MWHPRATGETAYPIEETLEKMADSVATSGSYTPVLTASTTNPTLGTGSTSMGVWYQVARLVTVEFRIRFGTSGASRGSGNYEVSLPIAADTAMHLPGATTGLVSTIGSAVLRDDSSVGSSNGAIASLSTATTTRLQVASGGAVTDSTPWPWNLQDAISGQVQYFAAP